MSSYISLLRGINVSGHNIIKMDALKEVYESLNFSNVKTYIQSGNVIFTASSKDGLTSIEEKIAREIKEQFGLNITLFVLTINQWEKIIKNNPFVEGDSSNHMFLYVTILDKEPDQTNIEKLGLKKNEDEEIRFIDNAVYMYCPSGYGKSKLSNNYIESTLKVKATTRNWKTTLHLLEMVKAHG